VNTKEAKEKLLSLIKARCPIIGIETAETRRFLKGLADIIETDDLRNPNRQRKALHTFSITRGLCRFATKTGEFEIEPGVPAMIYQERQDVPPGVDPAEDCFAITQAILEQDAPSQDGEGNEPKIYVMKDVHAFFEHPLFIRGLRDLAEELIHRQQTIILVSPDLSALPDVLRKDVKLLAWPLPGQDEIEEQIDLFSGQLVDAGREVDLDQDQKSRLVDALRGLTLNEGDQCLAEAVIAHGVLDERAVEFVTGAKAEITKASGALEYIQADGQVGGLDLLRQWLVQAGRTRTAEARHFGISPARGVLVVGVPGCGKSLTAKRIAQEWQVPLTRLDVGALFGSLVGESEARVREALRIVTAISPAILWIDEIEKLLGSSGGEQDGGTSKRVLATILTWMEENRDSGVFIYATANDISDLRPELVRRFSETFFVDLPTPSERRAILSIHIAKSGRDAGNYDLTGVVDTTERFTGAECEETVQGGLWKAFQEGEDLTAKHMEVAAREMVPLVTTMKEGIDEMRQWAARARPASLNQPSGRTVQQTGSGRAGAIEI